VKHLSRSDVLRGSVVVTPVEGELHTLGARLLMDALEADRWQVKFLGASTPVDEVVEFARIRQPDIVALSCSCPESIEPLRRTIVGLRALEPTPLVAVGGWLFTGADGPHLGEQADLWSTDAFEAASQLASRPMRGMH
jgi:methanogenic corrinoid protein MtbC1